MGNYNSSGATSNPPYPVLTHCNWCILHVSIGVWVGRMLNLIWIPLKQLRYYPFLAKWMSGLITLAIIWLSLTPQAELPEVPGSDKTHHIIAYAALAIPTAFAYPRRIFETAAFYILLGGLIELVQPYVNRYGELLDFMANLSGVILGTLFGLFLSKCVKN